MKDCFVSFLAAVAVAGVGTVGGSEVEAAKRR